MPSARTSLSLAPAPHPTAGVPVVSPKVLTRDELMAKRAEARRQGLTVVQCHGCFDIVHPGHIRHLRHAKAQGQILLVSLSSDAEVKKGAGRPLIPEELRADNLAALDFVDWVYVEPRPMAAQLLEEVQPDVYVKGREYEFNNDPRFRAERAAVEAHGGRVFFSSGDVVFSSTALIASLEQSVDPYHARLSQLAAMPELEGAALTRIIAAFRGKRVVVAGETITDTYVLCDRPSVAGESPIMTLRPIERRTYDGGAAIIARHLAAMGASPVLVTALPCGEAADALRQRLLVDGVDLRAIDVPAPMAEKQRFLVGAQKVMKLDLVDPLSLDAAQQDTLVGLAAESADGCDAAIIADFGLGLFSPGVLSRMCPELRRRARVLAGDISGRRANLRRLGHMDLLCPTESELRESVQMLEESLPTVAWRLMAETHSTALMVTMGADGLVAFDRLPGADQEWGGEDEYRSRVKGEHVPALCAHAVDPLGCGDSLLAAATLSLAAGGSLLAAALLGSLAAASQAQRLGNIPISATDLRHGVARIHTAHLTYTGDQGTGHRIQGTVGALPVPCAL